MLGLKYVSWADTTGYAIAAKAYVRGLIDAGISLSWRPMLPGENGYEYAARKDWGCPKLNAASHRDIPYDTVLIHTVPEYFPDCIQRERGSGRRIFGYTVWEHERLPAHWPEILNRLDGVIVPCEWNVQIFRGSGVLVPIHVVPHLPQHENHASSPTDAQSSLELATLLGRPALDDSRFVFYTIGFWSHRKAPYLVVDAFLSAFTNKDAATLIVKTSEKDTTRRTRHWRNAFRLRHPSAMDAFSRQMAGYRQTADVRLIARDDLSDAQIQALHARGDCYVSLTRTEGWGLGAYDAVWQGNPVIMTGHGGQLDFLDPDLSHLIDYELVPAHEPSVSSLHNIIHRWAQPSVKQAADRMREVFESQEEMRTRAKTLSVTIQDRFAPEKIIARMIDVLENQTA